MARLLDPKLLIIGLCGGLAVFASVSALSTTATALGRNGRIVYMVKDGAGHWQIWTANANLSGARS